MNRYQHAGDFARRKIAKLERQIIHLPINLTLAHASVEHRLADHLQFSGNEIEHTAKLCRIGGTHIALLRGRRDHPRCQLLEQSLLEFGIGDRLVKHRALVAQQFDIFFDTLPLHIDRRRWHRNKLGIDRTDLDAAGRIALDADRLGLHFAWQSGKEQCVLARLERQFGEALHFGTLRIDGHRIDTGRRRDFSGEGRHDKSGGQQEGGGQNAHGGLPYAPSGGAGAHTDLAAGVGRVSVYRREF